MQIAEIILLFLSFIMMIPTLASLTRFDHWWIRGFDFPRVQISLLLVLLILISIILYSFEEPWQFIILLALFLSLLYQIKKIFPFTPLAKKDVLQFSGSKSSRNLSILVSNVLTQNTNYGKLLKLVKDRNPDILLTLESDKRWEEELEVLEKDYPYTVKVPQDNLYGMHLYSKLKLEEEKVRYIVQDDIPSIDGYLRLDENFRIRFHCLHPMPPSPSEADTSTNRDAELLMLGRDIRPDKESVVVFGDLNDVAWSRTTKLFKKMSGLLDPRVGRGFFNTFHADYFLLRWPLDHIFHSNDFTLIDIASERHIGSDHFPMFIKLNYEPRAENIQQTPEADKEDKKRVEEKIDDANPREQEV
ncbi:endonuclease/exonuclease/phosphatase family protein [Salegentibacter sp. F188]|uniref:Endonuclease/exonuclease/phosphatase family protein n=1 Tax=Autumnicola patrickiae TaxID=3075591 RepID=A0ABU3E1H2_9FLAO|nr:endonuclease/exonuclease/phosphatase family protein [Salegentibacter sp. F188]MDT0689846.1 endonuclease/exonuclease/phosphatase family protein [Salegentibacter sp. F188]